MLPTYARPGGATDEASNRMSAPLLAIRKARANDPPAWGLLVLTAACCLLIVIQVRLVLGRCASDSYGISQNRRTVAIAPAAFTCHAVVMPAAACPPSL